MMVWAKIAILQDDFQLKQIDSPFYGTVDLFNKIYRISI